MALRNVPFGGAILIGLADEQAIRGIGRPLGYEEDTRRPWRLVVGADGTP